MAESEIKLVELDNFYENLDNPHSAGLFAGILAMRKNGYESFYPKKFIPFDKTDLIAKHYLICAAETDCLIPLAGYKRVTLIACDDYQIVLPIQIWAKNSGDVAHFQAVNEIIRSHRVSGQTLTYGAHIVLHKRAKEFITSDFFKEFAAGACYLFQIENGSYTELINSTLRTRTNVWFEQIGYQPLLSNEGNPIAPARHPESPDDSFIPMIMRELSEWSKECYEKHRQLFAERLVIK